MPGRKGASTPWFVVLLFVAAVVLWIMEGLGPSRRHGRPERGGPSPDPVADSGRAGRAITTQGGYEVYQNCALVPDDGNDGDSFKVRLPDGRIRVFRLYFVDTPESRFRRYAGGDTNHERIRQQAAELGGISPAQAVEIGAIGKKFTQMILGQAAFTLFTNWDSPFHDERFHAFVEVTDGGKPRWLHEMLVERGLARIKTKPADMPDGTPSDKHRDHLRAVERSAKARKAGAWAL